MRVFRERLSICVCSSFPFGFKGGMWDLIVLVVELCLSIYFVYQSSAGMLWGAVKSLYVHSFNTLIIPVLGDCLQSLFRITVP